MRETHVYHFVYISKFLDYRFNPENSEFQPRDIDIIDENIKYSSPPHFSRHYQETSVKIVIATSTVRRVVIRFIDDLASV